MPSTSASFDSSSSVGRTARPRVWGTRRAARRRSDERAGLRGGFRVDGLHEIDDSAECLEALSQRRTFWIETQGRNAGVAVRADSVPHHLLSAEEIRLENQFVG